MKKKIYIICLFILIILCSGCTPEYSIEIKNNKITEKLSISNISNEYTLQDFPNMYSILDEEEEYLRTYENNIVNYKYTYNFSNFYKSRIIKYCYNAFNLVKDKDAYLLQTGNEFKCYPLQLSDFDIREYEKLTIKIKITDYEVIENNADEISNDIYIWNINKDNYSSKVISIKFKEKAKEENKDSLKDNNSSIDVTNILLIISVIIIIGIAVVFYALNLNQKRNKL